MVHLCKETFGILQHEGEQVDRLLAGALWEEGGEEGQWGGDGREQILVSS